MKFRIGVDFDNTIACYEHVFTYGAQSTGLLLNDKILSKSEIKGQILSEEDGDINWQKLQGQIYGKFMHKASIFPGFAEFLLLAKLRGHEIYIVSHKTPFGHFDEEKISLPDEAMRWLIANKLVDDQPFAISGHEVFFEPTRELKIERIKSIKCTHFIDDLEEVLEEASFDGDTQKYLFNTDKADNNLRYASGSWRGITKQILGDWTDNDILLAVKTVFTALNIQQAQLIKGRGNSRIYKLYADGDNAYALKIYPDLQFDPRKRLETEYAACLMLTEAGFPVMQAIAKNERLNWAIYSWLDGEIETPDERFIERSVELTRKLMLFSHASSKAKVFSNASEACLSGTQLVKQIQKRYDRLINSNYNRVKLFLTEEFLPVFQRLSAVAENKMQGDFDVPINQNHQIISPSDFGAHNAILCKDGRTYFIDFEYLGWDDPVKIVCDFYWHPAMNINGDLQKKWINEIKGIFADDTNFDKRINAYIPLFGLRWCLILLNEFLPEKISQRIHADHEKQNEILNTQQLQFDKAQKILKIIKQY